MEAGSNSDKVRNEEARKDVGAIDRVREGEREMDEETATHSYLL